MNVQDQAKKNAACAALEFVQPGMLIGVGTGSTTNFFIDALKDSGIRLDGAVASSEETHQRLINAGIEVMNLNDVGSLSLYIDGADEINPLNQMIKGGGAALTREKIIAQASKTFVCIVDESKCVPYLGRFPLPIEVIPMARSLIARQLITLGGQPELRHNVTTDNGHMILDVRGLKIDQPIALEETINQWPGVVTNGLFARRAADHVIIGTQKGHQSR